MEPQLSFFTGKKGNIGTHAYPMTALDIDRIVDIERTCFPAPWPHSAFISEIDNPHSLNIVIKDIAPLENQSICAYSCNHVIAGELSILRMAVVAKKRRTGIGAHLLGVVLHEAILRGATEAFLEVRPSNFKARSLYQKLGFRVIGTRPNYYPETGEHALLMMKTLKETS